MAILDRVRDAVAQALEARRFASRHKLVPDHEVKGRYYLSAARDRSIDADLSDPEVRAAVEEVVREYRLNPRVRKTNGKKNGAADAVLVDTSCLRFTPPSGPTPSSPSRKTRRG